MIRAIAKKRNRLRRKWCSIDTTQTKEWLILRPQCYNSSKDYPNPRKQWKAAFCMVAISTAHTDNTFRSEEDSTFTTQWSSRDSKELTSLLKIFSLSSIDLHSIPGSAYLVKYWSFYCCNTNPSKNRKDFHWDLLVIYWNTWNNCNFVVLFLKRMRIYKN